MYILSHNKKVIRKNVALMYNLKVINFMAYSSKCRPVMLASSTMNAESSPRGFNKVAATFPMMRNLFKESGTSSSFIFSKVMSEIIELDGACGVFDAPSSGSSSV